MTHSDDQKSGFESVSEDSLNWIDVVCDRFQASLRDGQPARIEELVAAAPKEARAHLVPELVEMEVHHRQQRGDLPLVKVFQGATGPVTSLESTRDGIALMIH